MDSFFIKNTPDVLAKKGTYGWAHVLMSEGRIVKRHSIKNSTAIYMYKNRLYHYAIETGIRYAYSPTNTDFAATDWCEVGLKTSSLDVENVQDKLDNADVFQNMVFKFLKEKGLSEEFDDFIPARKN